MCRRSDGGWHGGRPLRHVPHRARACDPVLDCAYAIRYLSVRRPTRTQLTGTCTPLLGISRKTENTIAIPFPTYGIRSFHIIPVSFRLFAINSLSRKTATAKSTTLSRQRSKDPGDRARRGRGLYGLTRKLCSHDSTELTSAMRKRLTRPWLTARWHRPATEAPHHDSTS